MPVFSSSRNHSTLLQILPLQISNLYLELLTNMQPLGVYRNLPRSLSQFLDQRTTSTRLSPPITLGKCSHIPSPFPANDSDIPSPFIVYPILPLSIYPTLTTYHHREYVMKSLFLFLLTNLTSRVCLLFIQSYLYSLQYTLLTNTTFLIFFPESQMHRLPFSLRSIPSYF